MAVRSLNKVMLIGNLTRDPNLRFTPSGTAVCSFGVATNRTILSSDGSKDERVDFHNIVAWAKLAEICGQLLHKGDKVYVEGRLQTRDWKTAEGEDRRITEIVIDQMMLLHSPSGRSSQNNDEYGSYDEYGGDDSGSYSSNSGSSGSKSKSSQKQQSADDAANDTDESVSDDVSDVEDVADDIPF